MSEVVQYVEKNVGSFHKKRLDSLNELKLNGVLRRKNPYLFKAKNILTAESIVRVLLDAYLSSQEEAIFGEFLEGLAIFINNKVYGGHKASSEGIDLEFDKDGIHCILAIKSGPNWGNSSQIRKMIDDFNRAMRTFRTNNPDAHIRAINGCCYGRCNKTDKGNYYKYCGQKFWEFISGNENLYTEIIEPLGHKAKVKNEEFNNLYPEVVNRFTGEFLEDFCMDGKIDWIKLVRFNSSILPPSRRKKQKT